MKEAICTGTTIEAAKAAAIAQLQAPAEADLNIEVLEMPVKKTFGLFGGAPAKVRVYFEEAPEKNVTAYLRMILDGIDMKETKIDEQETEDGIVFQLNCGNHYGTLIGHRGDTLDAVQYLVSLVANRGKDEYTRITINAGDYREKREGALRSLAQKKAQQVTQSGRNIVLEPMNPYERRIIHTAVQEIEGAASHSIGEDQNRRVVITLKEGVQPKGRTGGDRRPGNNNRGGSNRPRNGGGYGKPRENQSRQGQTAQPRVPRRDPDPPKQATIPIKPVQPEQPKEHRSDFSGGSRYGKIEPKE